MPIKITQMTSRPTYDSDKNLFTDSVYECHGFAGKVDSDAEVIKISAAGLGDVGSAKSQIGGLRSITRSGKECMEIVFHDNRTLTPAQITAFEAAVGP